MIDRAWWAAFAGQRPKKQDASIAELREIYDSNREEMGPDEIEWWESTIKLAEKIRALPGGLRTMVHLYLTREMLRHG
jgi:hypothetical protein